MDGAQLPRGIETRLPVELGRVGELERLAERGSPFDLDWRCRESRRQAGADAHVARPHDHLVDASAAPVDIDGFSIVELVDEIEALPAARWMRTYAPTARVAARCSNIPSVHLAIKSGAGIAPLPAVYAAADEELVCVLGPLPELNYPMFLLAHRDIRKVQRVNAVFEFCLIELKTVLMRGEMKK